MSDSGKTKRELIAELEDLRRSIEKLRNAASAQKKNMLVEREPRHNLKADIEFIGDFDLIKAQAINVSRGGICFKTSVNLPFEMRYQQEGKTVRRRAHLIWLKHEKKGGYNFGLKFVSAKKFPQF